MQAIMLAAGMGSRLGKYTQNNTKCMLAINGVTLLERAINALLSADIHKLILVVGYKMDNLKAFIKEKKLDQKITIEYIDNHDYNHTNNIYSLYMAKDYFALDDTILLESDLIYDEDVIKELVKCPYPNVATVAKYQDWMDGTVVTLDEDNNIVEFIEKIDFDYHNIANYYKTVNIYKFSKDFMLNYYLPFLKTYIDVYGKNDYYELVLKVISSIKNSHLKAFELKNKTWYEIDDCQDYDIATLLFSDNEKKLELYQQRFGGYWRFNDLEDYCYLVNPYFPNNQMLEKMQLNFTNLLTSYPSTMRIESNCISRLFNIDEKKVLVGNGAAELINGLNWVLKGKTGVIVPTFNEYIRCLRNSEIIKINSADNNYQITKDMLLSKFSEVDNLVIINPDNPSGSFLSEEDALSVIDKYCKSGKIVVFDESFIDFANETKRYTLLTDEILDKYPNLIVIKSISKSYGIPGLRIGALATSNLEIIATIKEMLPVWNINSFAEYFLQIFPLFRKNYTSACNKIAEERNVFIENLQNIPYIEVYPSEANYVMCRLKNKKAHDLTLYLLENYHILIKDLSHKEGFNDNFIRLAVKDHASNMRLIEALQKYK